MPTPNSACLIMAEPCVAAKAPIFLMAEILPDGVDAPAKVIIQRAATVAKFASDCVSRSGDAPWTPGATGLFVRRRLASRSAAARRPSAPEGWSGSRESTPRHQLGRLFLYH